MEGLCPDRAAKRVFPNLPRFACADRPLASSASLPVGRPLPLRLATPAFARWRSACTCRVSTRTCKSQTQGEDTMNSGPTTHYSQEKPQPKTAKEVIAANVQSLIEQLEAGHSDALTAYLNAMTRRCASRCRK